MIFSPTCTGSFLSYNLLREHSLSNCDIQHIRPGDVLCVALLDGLRRQEDRRPPQGLAADGVAVRTAVAAAVHTSRT